MQNRGDSWAAHLSSATSLPLAPTIQQIDALQMLRAAAVILVIWTHAGQVLSISGSHGLPALNVFGIDIFFVLSGFILSLVVLRERRQPGLEPMADFMKRRLIRIYPIYWFVALLMLARIVLSHRLFQHNYLPALLLLPSLHYPSNDPLIIGYSWTMMFEMFFYFVLGLLLLKTVKWAVPALIAMLTISVGIGAVVSILHPIWIVVCNPILLEFVFGAILSLLYARVGRRRIAGIVLTATGVVAAILLQMHNPPAAATGLQMVMVDKGVFLRVATWGVCAAVIVAGLVFWSPSMKSTLGKWSVVLGNASYSTYLVSALVLEFSSRLFFKLNSPSQRSLGNRFIFETSLLVSVLTVGFFCYIFVEKPLLRALQKRLLPKVPIRSSNHIQPSHAEDDRPGNTVKNPAT